MAPPPLWQLCKEGKLAAVSKLLLRFFIQLKKKLLLRLSLLLLL